MNKLVVEDMGASGSWLWSPAPLPANTQINNQPTNVDALTIKY
jgi:hypothetical protein